MQNKVHRFQYYINSMHFIFIADTSLHIYWGVNASASSDMCIGGYELEGGFTPVPWD